MSKQVRVELGEYGNVIRIFRDKSWRTCRNPVQLMDKAQAVSSIRMQVYARAGVENTDSGPGWHECERCGRSINGKSMEMHERVPKGSGGEVSLENCEALCHQCHTGSPDSAHGNRRWQTAKLRPNEGPND